MKCSAIRYLGIESFTTEQKLAYDVGYQHGSTDAIPEPVSVDLGAGASAIGETLYTQFGFASSGDYKELSKACAEAWRLKWE